MPEEVSYHLLSLTGKVYHIVLPDVSGNRWLCNSNREAILDDPHLISGRCPLVSVANAISSRIPRPGVPCSRCLRKIAVLHDRSHIGPDEYEHLVLKALQTYCKCQGKTVLATGRGKSNIWVGQSGCEHQIDVSVELEDEVVLAECKCQKREVGLSPVLTFLARIMDIKPTKPEKNVHGIVFSNLGFQGGQGGNIWRLVEYYECIETQVLYSYGWDNRAAPSIEPMAPTAAPGAGGRG